MKHLEEFKLVTEKIEEENPNRFSDGTIQQLLDDARWGNKIVLNGRAIWSGLGDRTSLYDYATQLLNDKWDKGGERLKKKLLSVNKYEDTVEVFSYFNTARYKGNWRKIRTYHVDKPTGRKK